MLPSPTPKKRRQRIVISSIFWGSRTCSTTRTGLSGRGQKSKPGSRMEIEQDARQHQHTKRDEHNTSILPLSVETATIETLETAAFVVRGWRPSAGCSALNECSKPIVHTTPLEKASKCYSLRPFHHQRNAEKATLVAKSLSRSTCDCSQKLQMIFVTRHNCTDSFGLLGGIIIHGTADARVAMRTQRCSRYLMGSAYSYLHQSRPGVDARARLTLQSLTQRSAGFETHLLQSYAPLF